MPAFGQKLGDRDIAAVLAYIKSRWPASVRQRQAHANR
jgi:mono/diheme cytochrome c family protein